MGLSIEQIMKLKLMEVDILRQFISICNKLGLKYYIIAGTLIGAVRHCGFIPWDDDIDVAMPREDFDRFVHEGQKYLSKELFIQTHVTDPKYALNIAKIRNSKTTFLEKSSRNCQINSGIFIDIFPLDNYPPNGIRAMYAKIQNKVYLTAIGRVFFREKRTLKLKINQLLSKLIYSSPYKALQKREQFIRSFPNNGLAINYCSLYGEKEIVPWEWYGDGTDVQFEGLTVKAPLKYDLLLRQIYGDYMKLPPVDRRVSNHDTDIIDLDKPYTYYLQV